jgi:ribosomal protein S18 acetylase RimI-like enzyme
VDAIGVTPIRDMQDDELDAVSTLLLRANREHERAFAAGVAAAYFAEVADVAGRAGSSDVLVAEQSGLLVGSATLLRDAADDGHPWPEDGCVLRLLAVAPEARGQGTGRALTSTCLDRARARGARWVGLHTAPFMAAARHLYERLGFVRVPEHDFDPDLYYGGARGRDEPPWGLAYVLRIDT